MKQQINDSANDLDSRVKKKLKTSRNYLTSEFYRRNQPKPPGSICGGAGGPGGGTGPPMTRLGAPCTVGPPTLTPVDRNKAYFTI